MCLGTAAVTTEQIKAGINISFIDHKSTRAPLAHTHINLYMNWFCLHWLLNWAPWSYSDWLLFGTPAPEMSDVIKAETLEKQNKNKRKS